MRSYLVTILSWIVMINLLQGVEVHEMRVNNAHRQNHLLKDKK